MIKLNIHDHSREFPGFTYVYPVLSRRIGGISLGVNLNINNACNWQCVYCQVPNLIRDKPVDIMLHEVEYELDTMLDKLLNQGYLLKLSPDNTIAALKDIAISGNGEPTLSAIFPQVVELIAKLKHKYAITDSVKTTLITNGSRFTDKKVLNGLSNLSRQNGYVWFKIDAIDSDDIKLINQVDLSVKLIETNLINSSKHCPTYIQTCIFKLNGRDPSEDFIAKYIDFIVKHKALIKGVLLYSTARAAKQGFQVQSVQESVLKVIADKLQQYNIKVSYYV